MRPAIWAALAATVLLAACASGEHEDIKKWMEDSSRDLRGSAPPLPELKPFPVVSYDASSQPDPFSPGRVEPEKKDGGGKKPNFDRPREQLEAFPLETLSYIGLVSKNKAKLQYGLIQANGVLYQVGKGNYIGQNFGRITEVTESEVILVETVQDPSGQTSDWVERRMTLQLQDGMKGKESK